MDITKEKKYIKQEIDNIKNEVYVSAIKRIIDISKREDEYFKPMTVQELIDRAIESEKAISEGRVIELDVLKEQVKHWR